MYKWAVECLSSACFIFPWTELWQPSVLGCSLSFGWTQTVTWRFLSLFGGSRYQHAEGGQGRFGRCFANSHLVQVPYIGLPGGDLLCGHVTSSVFCEVIAAHELALTDWTHKLLFSCMGSPVTGQFIRAGKPLIAAIPTAAERLLSCVCAQVGFEVRAFEVCFSATREVAHIISSARKVHFCGSGPWPCRHIYRGWCQR